MADAIKYGDALIQRKEALERVKELYAKNKDRKAMHDVVIRAGTVVDGSGEARFTGDVAIDGDRIVAVGDVSARGRREVDADGLLVTPGWVDIHTHYDGQALWDPYLTPSSWHGCTSVVAGKWNTPSPSPKTGSLPVAMLRNPLNSRPKPCD